MSTVHTWTGYGQLNIKGPFELQRLHELKLERRAGEHAYLQLTAIIPDQHTDTYAALSAEGESIEIQETDEQGSVLRTLFQGFVRQLNIETVRGIYYLKLDAVSHSARLDHKVQIRSFQRGRQTSGEVIEAVLSGYAGSDVIDNATQEDHLESLVLQYRETDWQFIKRLASRVGAVVIPESAVSTPKLWIGIPEGGITPLPEDVAYTMSRDLQSYAAVQAAGHEVQLSDFTTYEIHTEQWLALGSRVSFRGRELAVGSAVTLLQDGILQHVYELRREEGIRQPQFFNEKIIGVSLDGKIIDLKSDQVRVHLDVDASQDKNLAVWIPYESAYTAEGSSGLYVMPKLGDAVKLYFPGAEEEEVKAQGSVRKGAQPSPKVSDPSQKYWGTDYGKELKMAPSELSLTAIEGSLFISLEDSSGITIQSDTALLMSAQKTLEITSDTKVGIQAGEGIFLLSGTSSVIMNGDTDILGETIYLDGLIKAPVSIEDLEPQPEAPYQEEVQAEEPPEKKSFWEKALDVTQIALDVVGLIPGVGEVADLANAGISLARGDYVGAALSAAAAIPFAGWAATGAKATRKVAKAVDAAAGGSKAAKAVKTAAKVTGAAAGRMVKSASEIAAKLAAKASFVLGKVTVGARKAARQLDVDTMAASLSKAMQKMKDSMRNMEIPRLMPAHAMAGGPSLGRKTFGEAYDEMKDKAQVMMSKVLPPPKNGKAGGGPTGSHPPNPNNITEAEFDQLAAVLKTQNLSRVMVKELKQGMAQNKFAIEKVVGGKAKYKIDVLDSKGVPTTSVWIDEFGKTTGMSWTVGTKVKRGSGYRRAKVPKGTERGHIKSVNEGALDNAVEDSPLNIIPQTRPVNDPRMKAFEAYRVKQCQGEKVITDILDDPAGYVRVQIPGKNINVVYNPLSSEAKDWPSDWYKTKGPFE
ncbi:contractile injection system protein, VgrG/Pvc8 family [Paenibacillus wulumuqiensis]|uniref:contractile injection system protein, VgrG/Pvc8 family n=1 Tax=Paenibacillus wulumuqiensis TaxID=1567107 RepID=UPI000697B024|nr:contractile injection system protein, VgrG/Pvc8 family [Paenibacillus wulumuqiensis]